MAGAKVLLAMINRDDPRYMLNIENKKRNVFVTQLGEGRDDEEEGFTRIPVVREPASKILDTSKNTLQKTLVLKKEVEFDDVSIQLLAKRQEFKERMELVDLRASELAKRQQECRDKALKFDQFLKDNDAKRKQAIQKYQTEMKQNEIKKKELDELLEELEDLRVRQQRVQKKLIKNKVYEDFLMKVIDELPENYLEHGIDSPLKAIIRRHEALAATNQCLIDSLITLSDKQESSQRALETLQRTHDTSTLMMNSELSRLHVAYEKIQEKNKQLEMNVNLSKGQFRYQCVELGHLLLALANLADQCHLQHYGPLEEVVLLSKLDMIKEFFRERIHVQQISRKLAEMESSVLASGDQSQKTKIRPKSTSKIESNGKSLEQTHHAVKHNAPQGKVGQLGI